MNLRDFSYHLPPDRIAQSPVQPRDGSRLLVLDREPAALRDRRFRDLPGLLRPGDVLVANDTRVLPARLRGNKASGGKSEVLLLTRTGHRTWEALVRAAKRSRPGTRVAVADGADVVVEEALGEGRYRVRLECEGDPMDVIEATGEMPLPPYISRSGSDPRDREWYQTVFAATEKTASAAAPTAGLHFTPPILDELEAMGVERALVTLHVGLGTFLPVRSENLLDHRMHREWYDLSASAASRVNNALEEGRRVVAVGTTSTRVLEHCGRAGRLEPGSGWTDLFLRPGHCWNVVSGMITNFHLPESTLLMLVCAFAGTERVLGAYRHAVQTGYRFYSYGDAMLLFGGVDHPA